MSWSDGECNADPGRAGRHGFGGSDGPRADDGPQRWPLTWRGLLARERWLWWEWLWNEVCDLRGRYRLSVRSQWWADETQTEVLAALAAWVDRYDSGEWDDPPGKLALLFDLERVATSLRDGIDPFHPDRDRVAFVRHLVDVGCQPPPGQRIDV